jgi:hypothetical protein
MQHYLVIIQLSSLYKRLVIATARDRSRVTCLSDHEVPAASGWPNTDS